MAANPQPALDRYHLEYLPTEELEACRLDVAWEARRGFADFTVCRECGARVGYQPGGKEGHLSRRHQLSVKDYRSRYGADVRLFSFALIARTHSYDVRQKMAEFANLYLTPDELSECRNDPEYEKHRGIVEVCICRECGKKLRSAIAGGTFHLRAHGLTRAQYLEKYPGAPFQTSERLTTQNKAQRNRLKDPVKKAKKKAGQQLYRRKNPDRVKAWRRSYNEKPHNKTKKKAAWAEIRAKLRRSLPADSEEKPFSWRVIGAELLARSGYTSNEAIAEGLDEAKFECPYGAKSKSCTPWADYFSTRAGVVFMNRIRDWVGKPGRQK